MKIKIRNKAVFTDRVTPLEEANKEISYRAALEGIVLLENDGTLPLVPGKIALTSPRSRENCAVRSRSRDDDQRRNRFG